MLIHSLKTYVPLSHPERYLLSLYFPYPITKDSLNSFSSFHPVCVRVLLCPSVQIHLSLFSINSAQ